MVRKMYYTISIAGLILVLFFYPLWHGVAYFLIFLIPYILIGLYDFSYIRKIYEASYYDNRQPEI